MLSTNRLDKVKQWLNDDKLECSETLGNILPDQQLVMYSGQDNHKPHLIFKTQALSVYIKAGTHDKVLRSYISSGQVRRKKKGRYWNGNELTDSHSMKAWHNMHSSGN